MMWERRMVLSRPDGTSDLMPRFPGTEVPGYSHLVATRRNTRTLSLRSESLKNAHGVGTHRAPSLPARDVLENAQGVGTHRDSSLTLKNDKQLMGMTRGQ